VLTQIFAIESPVFVRFKFKNVRTMYQKVLIFVKIAVKFSF